MTPVLVFKNQYFVAIDKPAATLSVPSRLGRQDPRPVAGIILQNFLGSKVYPLHRLDEDVSGILLFALTSETSRAGNLWFENNEIIKTYEALSAPLPAESHLQWSQPQQWESLLVRGKKRSFEAPYGKPSVTHARFICHTDHGRSLWQLQPKTGRSHQLRYEMAKHGFPIDGDILYGSRNAPQSSGIDLRAFKLNFSHCRGREKFQLPEELCVSGLGSKI